LTAILQYLATSNACLSMAQIQPPTSTPAATTATAPSTSVTPVETTVASLPDKIQQLLRQIQVSGTIAQPPDAGTITLNTAIGQLTLLLPQLAQEEKLKLLQLLLTLFQNQRPLTVVVQPGAPPAQAFLLLPPLPTAPPPQNILDTISLTQTAPQSTQPLTAGLSLPAIVLPAATTVATSPASTPLPMPPQLSPALTANLLKAEINLPTTILTQAAQQAELTAAIELPVLAALEADAAALQKAVNPPPSNVPSASPLKAPLVSVPLANALPANTPAANAPAVNVPPPNAPNIPVTVTQANVLPSGSALAPISPAPVPSLPSLLQAGNEVILNVNAVVLPSQPAPVPTAANQVVATVVGNGPNGQLILKADDAVLYVKQSVAAPIGARVLVSVEAAKPPLVSLADEQNFPALQQVLSALAQADPQFVQQFLQSNIPQPNAQLPSVLLFFLSAFKQGEPRNWLGGAAADILTHIGKFELAARLIEDMTRPAPLVRDSTVGEWRPYQIPLYAEGRLQALNLYVRNDHHGHHARDEARPGAAQVRFLIDMRMSKLGAIQLDGLVQPKKLDMIVRSENSLPAGLPNELRDAYIRTLGALGYTGGLSFQTGRKHWLVIQQDMQKSIMT
jgi:hypothetical protein